MKDGSEEIVAILGGGAGGARRRVSVWGRLNSEFSQRGVDKLDEALASSSIVMGRPLASKWVRVAAASWALGRGELDK